MSFKAYRRDDLKAIDRIRLDNENVYHERHVIIKILKLNENNQYGYPMTKPIPTVCIKEHPSFSSPASFCSGLVTYLRGKWNNCTMRTFSDLT